LECKNSGRFGGKKKNFDDKTLEMLYQNQDGRFGEKTKHPAKLGGRTALTPSYEENFLHLRKSGKKNHAHIVIDPQAPHGKKMA